MKIQGAPIEIFIVDDQELLRHGLRRLLEGQPDIEIIGEAENGDDLLKQLEHSRPDVILMDIQMPVMNGINATKIITKKYPGMAVIGISVFDHEYNIIKMILAGAKGFLSKGATKPEFIAAIQAVCNNKTYYDEPADAKVLYMITHKVYDPVEKHFALALTARETEILRLICMQRSNREICAQLNLSIRTIEDHRNNLLIKTMANNTAGLVLFALRYGIFNIEESY